MKVSVRDYRRDTAFYVDVDKSTDRKEADLAWLEKVGEAVCLVGLVAVALMAMAIC